MALLLAAAALFPLIDRSPRDIDAATNAGIYVLLALGMNLIVGFAGLLNLGYAAFFAVGAYTYGILASMQFRPLWSSSWAFFERIGFVARVAQGTGLPDLVRLHFSFWMMLPVAALLAALVSLLIGLPTLRLKGDYLAIVTLAFGEIVPLVIRNTPAITGGAAGLTGVRPPSLFGRSFGFHPEPFFYLMLVEVVLALFLCSRLKSSRAGRAWRALKDDELAAGCLGVNPIAFKLLAFAMGSAFAAVAGSTLVSKLTTATPDMFRLPLSVGILVMVILGGIGSIPGVVVGAVALSLLQSVFLQELTTWTQALGNLIGVPFLAHLELVRAIDLFYGLILVTMMLYRRQGLIPEAVRLGALLPQDQQALPRQGSQVSLRLWTDDTVTSTKPLLVIEGLTKRFGGVTAVDGVALTVCPKQILSVIGPNGSGKTTLFNLITGVVVPDSGQITFAGEDISHWAPHRIAALGVARTFQTLHLFPSMTVLENLLVSQHSRLKSSIASSILRTRGVVREERMAVEWAREVLSIFGSRLLPRADHIAGSLSYANRRRLEIARALALRPKLLLLDEPTAGMNPAETLELMDQIRGLRDLGLTVMLIEHKLQVVMNVSERVVVLDYGKKIAEGSPEDVRKDENVITA